MSGALTGLSMFNSSGSSNTTSYFTPITISADTLTASYSAKLALSGAGTSNTVSTSSSASSSKTNNIKAPWELGKKASTISGAYLDAMNLSKFINLNADSVTNANGNADYKELFALFNAMGSLRSLAEYATQDTVTSGVLGKINDKFQSALTEVRNFISSYSSDKLTLLYGDKSDQSKSTATLGAPATNYVGRTAVVGSRTDPIAGLTGNEQFQVAIKKGTTTENFNIDLSQVSGPLNLDNINKYINQVIHAEQATDTSGNLVFDDNGNPVQKYTSYFSVQQQADNLFSFKIVPAIGEEVTLSAASATPSVYVTGTTTPVTSGTKSGFLTKLDDLSNTDPTRAFGETIAALAPGETAATTSTSTTTKSSSSSSSSSTTNTGTTANIPVDPKTADTSAAATATDSQGNVYVLGATAGDLGSEINRTDGSQDVYLSKYNSQGSLIWQRLVGASTESSPGAVTVDANDNVIIAGYTPDNLTPAAVIDSVDSFVAKYSSTGENLWTHQVNAVAPDRASSLTTDAAGNVYFGGYVSGNINASATNAGGADAYVVKLDGSSGSEQSSTQYGTAGSDRSSGLAVASDGNILTVGTENGHAVLRKLDATDLTNQLWSVDLGDLQGGTAAGVKVAADGSIFVAGTTGSGSLAGSAVSAYSGGNDGFVTKITDNGSSASANWTNYIGTSASDSVTGLDVGGGKVYLTGSTDGTLPGETKIGATDAFAASVDAGTGATDWLYQFGTSATGNSATGISYTAQGSSVLSTLGLPSGTVNADQDRSIISQTSLREGDYFYVSVNGGAKRKITIDSGDTYTTLAAKVKRASFLYVNSYSSPSSTAGASLVIKALHGGSIDLIPGDGTHDALKGLGLEATKLQSEDTLVSSSSSSSSSSSASDFVFGLGLTSQVNLLSKDNAKAAMKSIDAAIGVIQSAYRKLNPDPALAALANQKKTSGTVPAEIQKQLANYQAALTRLTA